MSEHDTFPAAPRDEPSGDSGDQAQRLQMAEEQEAIAAALAGSPRGTTDDASLLARIEGLEGEDPASDPAESDSSDDPTYGGGLSANLDPADRARKLMDDAGLAWDDEVNDSAADADSTAD